MHSLNIRLSLTVFVLLVSAMLLIDLVISGVWAGRLRLERRAEVRTLAEHVQAALRAGQDGSGLKEMARGLGHCLFVRDVERGRFLIESCEDDATARRYAEAGGQPKDGSPLLRRDFRLYVEIPAIEPATGRPLRVLAVEGRGTALRSVLALQPIVGFYILLNALVLGLVAWARFSRSLSRPLRNLTVAIEQYREDSPGIFPEQSSLSEMHGLSYSLNRMIRRIERDRLALQQAAAELEAKNTQILAQQQEMIRAEKLAATGRLAAGLAHEIGNPLGVVQGYLELLGMPDCTGEERRDYVANALEETRRMHRLITMLLQAARHRPDQPQTAERLDLRAFMADFLDTMRPQSLFRGIGLRLTPETDAARVEVPPDALRQVLLNALLNAADAIRAAREEGGRIDLGLARLERDGRAWCEVTVADNGCGLAPEHADKIFDQFFTTKEPGAGTGLGLSVSLALVEGMGGGLRAENREDGGMILRILLPAAPETETTEATP